MKKQLIVLILRLLESESDSNHPMTQTEIAAVISKLYPCDRKTVSRNIKFLQEVGYPIVKTQNGVYMDGRTFNKKELDYVLTSVKANQEEFEGKEELCIKLRELLISYYRRYW